jgi:small-conductance mechanosensitive channel
MALAIPNVFGDLLTNIITAILILLIGFVAGKVIGLLLNKLFTALSIDKKVKKKNKLYTSFAKGLSGFISLCIYIVAIVLALKQLKILNLTLKIMAIIIAILILGALIFSLINFMLNLVFGLKIMTSKKFEKGDTVKIKKIEGRVERIGLSHTRLKTSSGELFVFSNKLFFNNKISVEKNKLN